MNTLRSIVVAISCVVGVLLVSMSVQADAIHIACSRGQAGEMRKLLHGNAKLVSVKDDGIRNKRLPLHYAVLSHSKDAVLVLLDAGASIDAKEARGLTPLYLASQQKGNLEIIALLLSKGADIGAQNGKLGTSALQSAVLSRDLRNVEVLLNAGADVNATDTDGATALHLAATVANNAEVVRLLLAHGAKVNAVTHDGRAPLTTARLAVSCSDPNIGALREAGALVDVGTPIISAILTGDKKGALTMLSANPALMSSIPTVKIRQLQKMTPLHAAALVDAADVAEQLLQLGAVIDARDAEGATPLHDACMFGAIDAAKLLVLKGADVNAKKGGLTPLHWAAFCGRLDIIRLLVDKGGDMATMGEGWNTLHWAALGGQTDAVELLLDLGAKATGEGKGGWQAIHLAASKRSGEFPVPAIEALLAKGASLNGAVGDGYTPLMLAAQYGTATTVRYLLAKGADVNARESAFHYTALYLAAISSDMEVVRMLVDAGADVNAKVTKTKGTVIEWRIGAVSPLEAAIHLEDSEMAEFLRQHGAEK